jgi:hypothetical protein
MIDMRSDCGEVQYDGFEYNWRFRQEGWRAEVGNMGSGGLVRRRKWVRLMMRPGKKKDAPAIVDESGVSRSAPDSVASSMVGHLSNRESTHAGSLSLPPSVMHFGSEIADRSFDSDVDDVWKGDVEMDWRRCHLLMKRLGRDGKKLELWKQWLEVGSGQDGVCTKGKQRQWTEDSEPLPSEVAMQHPAVDTSDFDKPALEHIAAVLRVHVGTF